MTIPIGLFGADLTTWEIQLDRSANSLFGVSFVAYKGGWVNYEDSARYLASSQPATQPLTVAIGFFPDSVGGTMTAAAQGDYDAYYTYVAQQLLDHGHADAIIRPGWEFNGDWYPWGYNAPGQDQANYAANYIAAFRDLVTAFKAVSPDFTFVWNPNLEDGYHYPDYQLAYPGDDVVDMVGVDVYDFPWSGIADPADRWAHDQAGPLGDIASFATLHNKPVSLPEWAAGEVGDNPYFVNAVADWLVGKNVGYAAYWSGDAASGYNGNLDIYPQQKEAFVTRFFLSSVACFCRGTLILTDRGEVPVEDMAIGDEAITFCGAARPIKWIGRRAYDGRFVAANRAVLPIRIEAGALADGVPARDLFVSPEHALYIDYALVPAQLLVNGATIRQVTSVERLEYLHIELDTHDVILAEGAPAESFVDCDNRLMFQNGAEFAALYPDDLGAPWDFCTARLERGSPELAAIRAALLERAEGLGDALDSDPDLHLVVDGAILRASSLIGRRYRFHIPAGASAVWLASRSVVPAEVECPTQDERRLGVSVERITLSDGDLSIEAWHGHRGLCDGFYDDEATHRWTDGLSRLPEALLRPFAGAFTLELHLAASALVYRVPAAERTDGAAA